MSSSDYVTPFTALITYRGYGILWFYDSNLAVHVANTLLAASYQVSVQLSPNPVYGGFELNGLDDNPAWTFLTLHGHSLFMCRHRSVRVGEWRSIGILLNDSLKKFKQNEKSCY